MSESPSLTAKVEELKLDDTDVVDPWNVTSSSDAGVDYDKLIGLNGIPSYFECKNIISFRFRTIRLFESRFRIVSSI